MSSLRKNNIIFFINSLLIFCVYSFKALAWNGYDYDKNTAVEIGDGNLVRPGELIKFYDWSLADYHKAEVMAIDDDFNSVRVEVVDLDTKNKETRIFKMDKE